MSGFGDGDGVVWLGRYFLWLFVFGWLSDEVD